MLDHGLARGFQGADESAGVAQEGQPGGVLLIPVGTVMTEVIGCVVLAGDLDVVEEIGDGCVVAGEDSGLDGDSRWESRGRVWIWSSGKVLWIKVLGMIVSLGIVLNGVGGNVCCSHDGCRRWVRFSVLMDELFDLEGVDFSRLNEKN